MTKMTNTTTCTTDTSTLTLEKLRETMREAEKHLMRPMGAPGPNPFSWSREPLSFCGMKVYEASAMPKLRVSDSCQMTDKARAEMNAWLLEMFGTRDVVPPGMAYVLYGQSIVMRPQDAAMLLNVTA